MKFPPSDMGCRGENPVKGSIRYRGCIPAIKISKFDWHTHFKFSLLPPTTSWKLRSVKYIQERNKQMKKNPNIAKLETSYGLCC